MKTIEELYNIAEHALDGFGEGCYALEYHDVEEDDGVPYEDGELAYAFFSIDSNGCPAYLGYASKRVQEPGTEDDGDLLRNPALHRCGCGIDMVVEVEEDDIR
jgi:hypothetical protein